MGRVTTIPRWTCLIVVVLAASSTSASQIPKVLGWWPFAGSTENEVGDPKVNGNGYGTWGVSDEGLSFSRGLFRTDYITFEGISNLAERSFTLEAEVKLSSVTQTGQQIIALRTSRTSYGVMYNRYARRQWLAYGYNRYQSPGTTASAETEVNSEFVNVIITFSPLGTSGVELRMYRNGEAYGAPWTISFVTSEFNDLIRMEFGGYSSTGVMRCARLYDTALDANSIKSIAGLGCDNPDPFSLVLNNGFEEPRVGEVTQSNSGKVANWQQEGTGAFGGNFETPEGSQFYFVREECESTGAAEVMQTVTVAPDQQYQLAFYAAAQYTGDESESADAAFLVVATEDWQYVVEPQGDIATDSIFAWQQYGFTFRTKPDRTSANLTFISRGGGCMLIDAITLRPTFDSENVIYNGNFRESIVENVPLRHVVGTDLGGWYRPASAGDDGFVAATDFRQYYQVQGSCAGELGAVRRIVGTEEGREYILSANFARQDGGDRSVVFVQFGENEYRFGVDVDISNKTWHQRRWTIRAEEDFTMLEVRSLDENCIGVADISLVPTDSTSNNLVANGDFEFPVTTTTLRSKVGESFVNGWEQIASDDTSDTYADGILTGPLIRPGHGAQSMLLHENCATTAGGIRQMISTQPGRLYRMTFLIAAAGRDTDQQADSAVVRFGTRKNTVTASIGNVQTGILGWTSYEVIMRASERSSALEFTAGPGHCIYIDNVEVFTVNNNQIPLLDTEVFFNAFVDDIGEYFVDGRRIGQSSSWIELYTAAVELDGLYAIHATDISGPGGILVALSDGRISDNINWRCTDNPLLINGDEWTQRDYNDSHWPKAVAHYPNGEGPWGTRNVDLIGPGYWIWSDDIINDDEIWCRSSYHLDLRIAPYHGVYDVTYNGAPSASYNILENGTVLLLDSPNVRGTLSYDNELNKYILKGVYPDPDQQEHVLFSKEDGKTIMTLERFEGTNAFCCDGAGVRRVDCGFFRDTGEGLVQGTIDCGINPQTYYGGSNCTVECLPGWSGDGADFYCDKDGNWKGQSTCVDRHELITGVNAVFTRSASTNPDYATDGDLGTLWLSELYKMTEFLVFDLGSVRQVSKMRIYIPELLPATSIKDFTLYWMASDHTKEFNEVGVFEVPLQVGWTTFEGFEVSARYFQLVADTTHGGTRTSLYEVEFYDAPTLNGDVPLAVVSKNQPTKQSSTYTNTIGGADPSRAVDGNPSGLWTDNSCTHTNAESNPWWRVDLGSTMKVEKVKIFNRLDCCAGRLNGFEIRVGDLDSVTVNPACVVNGEAPSRLGNLFDCGLEGRYVYITIPGENKILTLCEVEVYAPVPASYVQPELEPAAEPGTCTTETNVEVMRDNVTEGLVARYNFENPGCPFKDIATNNHAKADDGAAGISIVTPGRIGSSAVKFSGRGALIVPQPTFRTSVYTISVWTNVLNGGARTMIGQGWQPENSPIPYDIWWSHVMYTGEGFRDRAGVDTFYIPPNGVNASSWFHVVSVRTETSRILYVNGVAVSSLAGGFVQDGPRGQFFIGAKGSPNDYRGGYNYFIGILDDVRIYNRALSSDEITEIYDGGFCSEDEYRVGDFQCVPLSTCVEGISYESKAPTPTSDRVCSSVEPCCDDGEECASFVSVPATLIRNSECAPCSTCPENRLLDSKCTNEADTRCKGCSSCNPGVTWISRPCTSTDDTVCNPCKTCDLTTTYESRPCGEQSDTECKPLTQCSVNEYISTPSTSTTDRVCMSVTACAQGEIEIEPPTTTSDRKCAACNAGELPDLTNNACTKCGPGTYVPAGSYAGTCENYACDAGTADLDQDSATECKACDGAFSWSMRKATVCMPHSKCPVGEEPLNSDVPSATKDRECTPCDDGFFKDSVDNSMCDPVTVCDAGTYLVTPSTISTNTVCEQCANGTYTAFPGQTECTPFSECGAGETLKKAGTHLSDIECESCPIGFFKSETGNGDCTPCRTFCPDGRFLLECPADIPGQINNARCILCPSGTFKAGFTGETECTPFKSCQEGEFVAQPATSSSDTACSPCDTCPQGSRKQGGCNGVANTICIACTDSCEEGKFLEGACTENEAPSCAFCDSSCATCSRADTCDTCRGSLVPLSSGLCGSDCGEKEYRDGNDCNLCSGECMTCSGPGADACTSCNPGKKLQGQTCQLACDEGFYENNGICVACQTCTEGFYQVGTCAAQDVTCAKIDECEAGEYQITSATATSNRVCDTCPSCPAGTFVSGGCDDESAYICTPCADGTYQDLPGQHTCKIGSQCPEGQEETFPLTRTSDRSCSDCAPGTIDDDLDPSTPCTSCKAGQYVPAGSFGPCSGKSCPAGYVNNDPVTECQPCPDGQYQPSTGTTSCIPVTQCKAGERELKAPTLSTDRICGPCIVPREYNPVAGQNTCIATTAQCPESQYQKAQPTATSDRECVDLTVCGNLEYESKPPTRSGDRTCEPLTVCDTNTQYESAPPTRTTDRQCLALQTCDVGTYELLQSTPSSDRKCAQCVAGRYKDTKGQGPCSLCNIGTTYQDEEGQASCKQVRTCGRGQTTNAAPTASTDRTCILCDPGTRKNSNGNWRCVDCAADEYQDEYGQRSCKDATVCAAGEFVEEKNTAVADTKCSGKKQCGAGQEPEGSSSTTSDHDCIDCKIGTYSNDNAPCNVCAPGSYQDEKAQASCKPVTTCDASKEDEIVAPTSSSDRKCIGFVEIFFPGDYAETFPTPEDATMFQDELRIALATLSGDQKLEDPVGNIELRAGSIIAKIDSANYNDLLRILAAAGEGEIVVNHQAKEFVAARTASAATFAPSPTTTMATTTTTTTTTTTEIPSVDIYFPGNFSELFRSDADISIFQKELEIALATLTGQHELSDPVEAIELRAGSIIAKISSGNGKDRLRILSAADAGEIVVKYQNREFVAARTKSAATFAPPTTTTATPTSATDASQSRDTGGGSDNGKLIIIGAVCGALVLILIIIIVVVVKKRKTSKVYLDAPSFRTGFENPLYDNQNPSTGFPKEQQQQQMHADPDAGTYADVTPGYDDDGGYSNAYGDEQYSGHDDGYLDVTPANI